MAVWKVEAPVVEVEVSSAEVHYFAWALIQALWVEVVVVPLK